MNNHWESLLCLLAFLFCICAWSQSSMSMSIPTHWMEGFTIIHTDTHPDPNATTSNASTSNPETTQTVKDNLLVSDQFPISSSNPQITNHSAVPNAISFEPNNTMPSYKQVTNHPDLNHMSSPDNGTCTPFEMCGALYNNVSTSTSKQEILPLPPVEHGNGARVGYFRAYPNHLAFSIPTNDNIPY